MTFEAVAGRLQADDRFTQIDPGVADDVLKSLRTTFDASPGMYERRAALCARIGAAGTPSLRRALADARDEFDRRSIASLVDGIQQAFSRSAAEGWKAWLGSVAETVARFRHPYGVALCEHPFAFDPSQLPIVASLREAVARMRQGRWDEVDETFAFLAAQREVVTEPMRVRLIVLQAQIELWRFVEKKRTAVMLAEAERLAPDDVSVLGTLGDLYAQQADGERAVRCYQRAIEVAPTDSNGYVGMGELLEKDEASAKGQRSDEAEAWFRRAVTQAPGDATGFDRLIRLLVRTDAYRSDDTECLELLERRIAVEPEGEFDACLAIADHCRNYCSEHVVSDETRRWYFAQSRRWYERAGSLHPDWPLAYTGLAQLCKDEGDLDRAESNARHAISIAPECPAGYLFLGPFYESRAQRKEAADIYERFPTRPYRWKLYATASLGRLQAELGDYGRARETLLGVLQEESGTDREQVFAEVALEGLADESYRKRDDDATARQTFDAILAVRGDAYRARYHHLVGNLCYYRSDYAGAAEHYRQAIAAAPTVAAYHRYLGVALRALSDFPGALVEIGLAFELDGDDKRRRDESASLANVQGNRAFGSGSYREAIAFYKQAVDLEPSTPVYQSNLALAFELLKERGARIESLEKAVEWYTRAQEVAGDQRHGERIELLRRRVELVQRYGEQSLEWSGLVTPIAVEIAEDLVPLVSGPTATSLSADLEREVEATRRGVSAALGITVPGVRFRVSDRPLPSGTYVVLINDVPLASGVASPGRRFFAGSAPLLAAQNVFGDPAVDPMTGEPGVWVAQKDWATATAAAERLWTVTGYMMRHLDAVIRRNAAEFVGHQEVVNLLANVSNDLRQSIAGTSTTLSALVNVCRALAAEKVTVGAFEELCKTFKALFDDNIRPRDIAERVRLLPAIRESLPGRDARTCLRAGEGFEAEIRGSLYRRSDRIVLAMTPERCQEALEAVRLRVGTRPDLAFVVADPAVRPFVRRLIEMEFHDLAVLSAAEARDEVELLPQRVDLDASSLPAAVGFQSPPMPGTSVPQEQTTGNAATGNEPACSVGVTVARGMPEHASTADDNGVENLLSLMRDGLFVELGVLVPQVDLRENADLPDAAFEVRLNDGEPVRLTGLQLDEVLINDTPDRLLLLGLHGRAATNPATGAASTIARLSDEDVQKCRRAGLTTWGRAGYLVLHVSVLLRRAAASLQTEAATRHLLDSAAIIFPALVQPALQRYSIATITNVLRHLLAEEISIRNLRGILECLLCADGSSDVDLDRFIVFSANAEPLAFDPQGRAVTNLPASVLAGHVRTWLKRYISNKYTGGSGTLSVYLLDRNLEQRLRQLPERPLTPDESSRLIEAVRKGLAPRTADAHAVLLTNFDVRATARAVLRDAFPMLSVLSYQELSPELNISPIARVAWS